MVVFDATTFILLVNPEAGTPLDWDTGKPVEFAKERVEGLIRQLAKTRVKVGLPAPALSEALVRCDPRKQQQIVEKVGEFAIIEILAFDQLSAIELAILTKDAIAAGDKKAGSSEIWSKVKFDRQIIATAKVRGASAIYTDDGNLKNFAEKAGLNVITLADVPVPEGSKQTEMSLEPPASTDDQDLNEIEQIQAENKE